MYIKLPAFSIPSPLCLFLKDIKEQTEERKDPVAMVGVEEEEGRIR
jgi:hypothetical protein